MLVSSFRRPGRARRRRALLLLLAALCIGFLLTNAIYPPSTKVSPSSTKSAKKPAHQERIFIASIHWNNELIIRSHWSAALLKLVRHFGAENVYVSIVEGGSWDDTKVALRDLDSELEKMGVEKSIVLHERTHKNEIERIPGHDGWIWTSRQKMELRRIPYLAGIRNQVMDKLTHLAERTDGQGKRSFDKILWLNDVIFTTEDVTTLLATRDGNYAAACSLDFSHPSEYYDTFALRDISGSKPVTQTWPFFLSSESRNAIMLNAPVPVKSCWNGIVIFQAKPFYQGLRFRGIRDSLARYHLEGSECCLVHADNPLSSVQGVWMNPNVRVAYNDEASKLVNLDGPWPVPKERLGGIWSNKWDRWTGFPKRLTERYVVDRRVRMWRSERREEGQEGEVRSENGTYFVENGWAHV